MCLTATFLQYLRPKAGSYKGGSAGGASPAAHGVPDCLVHLVQRQDSMKRSLERTGQSWTQSQIQRDSIRYVIMLSFFFLVK